MTLLPTYPPTDPTPPANDGGKPALQSKTVVSAITMGLAILAAMGVKWTVSNETVQRIADLVVVLSALLGTPTVVAFRMSARQKIEGWVGKKS